MADIEKPVKKEDVQVFRFKFTQEIMNMLQEFAQIHKLYFSKLLCTTCTPP